MKRGPTYRFAFRIKGIAAKEAVGELMEDGVPEPEVTEGGTAELMVRMPHLLGYKIHGLPFCQPLYIHSSPVRSL